MDLSWCLEPILVPMKLLGVDLISWNHASSRCQLIMNFYSFIWLLTNVKIQISTANEVLESLKKDLSDSLTSTKVEVAIYTWNVAFDYFNITASNAVNHLIILYSVRNKWGQFNNTFYQSLTELNFDFKQKIRRIAMVGLVYTLATVGWYFHHLKLKLIS